jgi:penicillin-binding protein 1A
MATRRRSFGEILRRLALVATVSATVGGIAGYVWLQQTVLSTIPTDLAAYRDFRPLTNCRVFGGDGAMIDEFYLERRVWVPLDELPPAVWQAFVVAEDRKFFTHPGVDVAGIARALWVNWRSGSTRQGASTLTQQLVKNIIVGNERSYTRKIKEAVLAWRLENELGKHEILELYLNYVALGSGNYGVEAAALDYFGTSARQLDAGQAALLAGLVPAPSRYSPRANPAIAVERRALVLRGMVAEGLLTAAESELLAQQPIDPPRRGSSVPRSALAYVTQVRREVRRLAGSEVPFALGLQVHTPIDLELQQLAEDAVRRALHAHTERQGRIGAVRQVNLADGSAETWLAAAHGLPRDPTSGAPALPADGACFDALVGPRRRLDDLGAGPFSVALRPEDHTALIRAKADGERPRPLNQVARPGDVLRVCRDKESFRLDDRPWSEGAAVVVENATGRILALVGGYDVGLEGFVRATQSRRQPGSSFKPYVYATALAAGRTQIDRVVDGPISLPAGGGRTWAPKNYSGAYLGPVTLRSALSRSLNTVSVRLLLENGSEAVADMATRMGVQSPVRKDPTIALGSSEVSPMDQAMGYATIARLGRAAEPVYIDRLYDAEGRMLAEAGEDLRIGEDLIARLPGGPGEAVLPPEVAYELVDMLREVVLSGTARKATREGQDIAGKTGTTNDYLDAWFIGFNPRYTIAVWIGTDGTTSLGPDETGGKSALPAWMDIATALQTEPGERFPVPTGTALLTHDGRRVAIPRGQIPHSALPTPVLGDAPLPGFVTVRPRAGR